jgi:hypothetical protein
MAAPEPSPEERQGLGLQDTWRRWSPPQLGGSLRSHRTHVSAEAHPSWEAALGAIGHMSAHGSTSYPSLWFHACTRGYRQWPRGPPRERQRTRRWGHHLTMLRGYFERVYWQSKRWSAPDAMDTWPYLIGGSWRSAHSARSEALIATVSNTTAMTLLCAQPL